MKDSSAWMYTILPISALSGGLGVLLPLYILDLHGTVYNVAIAITLFEFISIPASILWGELTDRLNKIKLFVLISIIGLFPILLIFYLLAFVPVIEGAYGVYAFIATASSPAINILIMSRKRNPALPKYFSRYSVLSISGSLIGTIPGLFISDVFIKPYLLFLVLLNVVSLILALLFIKSDKFLKPAEEHRKSVRKSFAILNMLSVTPYQLTGQQLIERIRSGLKNEKIRHIYALLATISLFEVGLFLFNTSYIPYLSANSVSYNDIFLINIMNSLAQLSVYLLVLSFIRKVNLDSYYKMSTIVRSIGYVVAFVPVMLLPAYFLAFNLAGYFIAGIAYAVWNVASSVLLYIEIKDIGKGHYVGVWAALLGLSAGVGAFLSGVISSQIGYVATFSAAIATLFVSFLIFTSITRQKVPSYKPNI